jgi:hypothetical protein
MMRRVTYARSRISRAEYSTHKLQTPLTISDNMIFYTFISVPQYWLIILNSAIPRDHNSSKTITFTLPISYSLSARGWLGFGPVASVAVHRTVMIFLNAAQNVDISVATCVIVRIHSRERGWIPVIPKFKKIVSKYIQPRWKRGSMTNRSIIQTN